MKLSVIVCARKKGDSAELMDSLHHGVGFHGAQIIEMVDQPSMGAGFNAGTKIARGDVLMFTHTDVRLWCSLGLLEEAIALAEQPTTGFVGVAGGTTLPQSVVWWEAHQKAGAVSHSNEGKTYTSTFGPFGSVQTLDGVLMMCARRKLDTIGGYDESLGWHFYDIDASLRMSRKFQNIVVPLPILHSSVGNITQDWHESQQKFLNKHKMI